MRCAGAALVSPANPHRSAWEGALAVCSEALDEVCCEVLNAMRSMELLRRQAVRYAGRRTGDRCGVVEGAGPALYKQYGHASSMVLMGPGVAPLSLEN